MSRQSQNAKWHNLAILFMLFVLMSLFFFYLLSHGTTLKSTGVPAFRTVKNFNPLAFLSTNAGDQLEPLATVVVQNFDVELSPDRSTSAGAGETVHFTHTLANTGGYPDSFRFKATSTLSSSISVPTPVPLGSRRSTIVTISIVVLPTAQRGQTDTISVKAVSESHPSTSDSVTDTIGIVKSGCEIGFDVAEPIRSARPSRSVSYTLTTHNIGVQTCLVSVTTDASQQWAPAITPSSAIALLPDQSADWLLSLTVPLGAELSQKTTNVTVSSVCAAIGGAFESSKEITTVVLGPTVVFLPIIAKESGQLQYLCNGDFETTRLSPCWAHSNYGAPNELPAQVTTTGHSAGYYALLGNPYYYWDGNVEIGCAWIRQTFRITTGGVPKLSFKYRIYTQDEKKNDTFEVYLNGHSILEEGYNGSGPFDDTIRQIPPEPYWLTCTVNLADPRDCYGNDIAANFIGADVTLLFTNCNRHDTYYNTWTYVDDVRITW